MKNFLRLTNTLILLMFLGGNAWGQSTYTENFDTDGNWTGGSGYVSRTYTNASDPSSDQFSSNDAYRITADAITGYAWKLDDESGAYYRYECEETVNSFSIWMARWDNSPKPSVTIRYSTNSGTSYTDIETIDGDYFTGDKTYKEYSHTFGTAISPETGEKVYIEFYTNSGERMLYDDFEMSYGGASGPDDPASFTAAASSSSQINLVATANDDTDDILVAYNSVNTFGTPTGTYSVDDLITDGGTVLYVGAAASLSNHTGLSSGQTVYYKAWSVNGSNEYSTGITDDATTFKAEPTNHVTGFAAGTTTSTSIPLSWTENDGAVVPDGYLIKASTGIVADPADGTEPADDIDLTDGSGNIIVAHGQTGYTFANCSPGTTYNFKIYPYTNSGDNIDYKITGAPSTSGHTIDGDTEVYAPTSQIAVKNISSLADSEEEGVNVFIMEIEDQGSGDGLVTKITNIKVKPHTTNTADWTDNIQGVKLNDGGAVTIGSPTITDTYIDIPITSGNLDVADEGTKTVTMSVYLNTSGIIDGQILSFMVDADDHGFTADASGSGFASSFLLGDFNSNNMTLSVEATQLTINQQPTNVNVDEVMSPAMTVAFTDENSNIDVDYNGDGFGINLTTTGTFSGSATIAVDATNGVSTFDNVVFSAEGTGITITANDEDGWSNTSATSSGFNATDLPKLIISEVADPGDEYTGRFVELYNTGDTEIDFSTVTVYIDRQANGGNHSSKKLTGTISPNQTYVIGNASNLLTRYSIAADLDFGDITGNGDDGYFLFFNGDETTGTLMDAYGVIDEDGTGKPWNYEDKKAVRNSNITTPNATWTGTEWTITAADVADCTPGEHNGNTSWKGGTGNWSTAANWSNGSVPTSTSDVFVPDGALLSVDVTDAVVNNINVQDGGQLTINSTQELSVSGTITIEDGGSFINNGTLDDGAKGDAAAVMQRSIDGYTEATNGWHLIGTPVGTFDINGSEFDPGATDDFYGYAENTYTWMNHKLGNPSQMIPGTGYLIAYETTATKNFTGTFNNADITLDDLSKTADKGEGWHLLGNPFQSALQWTDTDWAKSNFGAGVKIMNPGGTYTDLTVGGTDIIPANQGFFAEATEHGNNSITIPASQRVHDTKEFYKSDPLNMLTLRASDGEFYVETWVQIMEDATAAYDEQYDVHFFGGVYHAPYLYSKISETERLSTNRIAPIEESTTIQLAFKSFLNKEFIISASGLSSFASNMDIILEDTEGDMQINLKETPEYTFMANADELSERFKLHLLKTTGIHEATIEGFTIYTHANTLYLNSDKAGNAQVEMYNVTGQKVFVRNVVMDGLTQINPQLTTGWYVVKVSTDKGMASEKVFIKSPGKSLVY